MYRVALTGPSYCTEFWITAQSCSKTVCYGQDAQPYPRKDMFMKTVSDGSLSRSPLVMLILLPKRFSWFLCWFQEDMLPTHFLTLRICNKCEILVPASASSLAWFPLDPRSSACVSAVSLFPLTRLGQAHSHPSHGISTLTWFILPQIFSIDELSSKVALLKAINGNCYMTSQPAVNWFDICSQEAGMKKTQEGTMKMSSSSVLSQQETPGGCKSVHIKVRRREALVSDWELFRNGLDQHWI